MVGTQTNSSLRRVPQQDRSNQRLELILDAAAALIDEVGYRNASMTLVARKAGMSGPGVYRYFSDLEAVARALAARNLERFIASTKDALSAQAGDWTILLSRVIDVYAELCRTEPGFRWLRLGDAVDRNLLDQEVSNRSFAAQVLTRIFVSRFNVHEREELDIHVEVVVEIVDGLIARAFATNPDGDQFFIDECSTLAGSYLVDYLARTYQAELDTDLV